MEAVLTCQLCFVRYDLDERKPKTLVCGHCFCLACLETWSRNKGTLKCPYDNRPSPGKPADLADSQAVKDLLLSLEVRCATHPGEVLSQFCMPHIQALCPQCPHSSTSTSTCDVRSITEDTQEILAVVTAEMQAKSVHLTLSKVLQAAVARRFREPLSSNIGVLDQLRLLERELSGLDCAACTKGTPTYFDISTYEAFCENCHTPQPAWVEIATLESDDLQALLEDKLKTLLKKVHFADIGAELLQTLEKCKSARPKELQKLGRELIALEARSSDDFSSLPATFYCPGCKSLQHKESCRMRVLPCSRLHALCENCLSAATVICPLDGSTLTGTMRTLPPLSQILVPLIAARKGPNWLPDQPCTPLPAWKGRGLCELSRFLSVLPAKNSDFPGWLVQVDRRQVEAVTFTCSGPCELVGVGVGNPVEEQFGVSVATIQLYLGKSAVGSPLAWHVGLEKLSGNDQILTYIYFKSAFPVLSQASYTLKIRLTSATPRLELYHGNPLQRPETFEGSDGLLWEFQETHSVENHEFLSSPHLQSGPILRLLYRPIKSEGS